ncbi:hypothetical protein [Rhizobium phage RHph_X2_24]|nr:hypothetical protein [Rhizobium phage RHph_X2_24]
MATHDADKTRPNPADRRTMTRDPNATGGPIVESGNTDKKGNAVTTAGSTHLTTNIDGKWYVVNSRGEKLVDKAFDTESDAVAEAQKRNPSDAVDQDFKEMKKT